MTTSSEDERSAILRGALAVLRRSGFDGFKVRLVLRETGLSARAFYRHFPDKDSLIVVLIRQEYAATGRRLTNAVHAAGADPEAQLAAWIRELLLAAADSTLAPRTRMFSAYHSLMSRFPEAMAQADRLVVEPLEAAIVRGQTTGVFRGSHPTSDARQVSRLVRGALNEVINQRLGSSEVANVIDSATSFVLRALRTPDHDGVVPPL